MGLMNTYSIRMPRTPLKKERWTLTFDQDLKERVQEEAEKMGVYPVQVLESLVRERLNPYGFQSVEDSLDYVRSLRGKSSHLSDKAFLEDLRKWQKS